MKKILLLLTLIVSVGLSVSATTWTSTRSTADAWDAILTGSSKETTQAPTAWTDRSNDLTASWAFSYEWASTTVYYSRSKNGLQFGSSSASITSLTLKTSDIPGTITSVTVNGVKSNGSATFTVSVGGTNLTDENTSSLSSTATDHKFIGSGSGEIVISFSGITAKKYIGFNGLTVEYTLEQKAVSDPKFTETEGENGFSVSMSCATDGATIYYTTDGSNPDANSTKYTAPVTYTDPISIKAVAIADSESSNVAAFTSNKYMRTDFADFITGNATGTGVIKNTITAIYQNGKNLYVKLGDTYMLVYGDLGKTLNNGDTFNRLEGTYILYNNGTPEFKDAVIGDVTTGGAAVEPAEITDLSTITSADVNKYVLLKGVSISGVSEKDATATDSAEKTIALRNNFELESFAEGSNLNVIGFVNYYKSLQVYPIEITSNEVAAPQFFGEDGETELDMNAKHTAGDVIKIKSAEGTYMKWKDVVYDEATRARMMADEDGWESTATNELEYTLKDNTLLLIKAVDSTSGEESGVTGFYFSAGGTITGVEGVAADAVAAPVEYFNLQGQRVANPTEGIFIRRQGNKVTKVVVR